MSRTGDAAVVRDAFEAVPWPMADSLDLVDRETAASAAMGRLRAVLRHALAAQPDLAIVPEQADRFAASDAALSTTTLCVAVLSPADGEFSYATCGHPPPLLADSGGTTGVIPVPRSAALAPGDVSLLTTLAAWRQPLPLTSLGIESPATRDAVPTLRHAFGDWLELLGIAFGDRQLAELAIAEVVTSAVEHAYPPGVPGTVRCRWRCSSPTSSGSAIRRRTPECGSCTG